MKFLVSIPKEVVNDNRWTTDNEPVVPCFPTQHSGAFLTVSSFKLADKAKVEEIDVDPDDMANRLCKEYPGLPRKLHENYVMGVYKAVFSVPTGTIFRVVVNQKQAVLVNDQTSESTIMWNAQPLT